MSKPLSSPRQCACLSGKYYSRPGVNYPDLERNAARKGRKLTTSQVQPTLLQLRLHPTRDVQCPLR